jgi:hypothetical protein
MSGGFQNHLYALYGLPGGFSTGSNITAGGAIPVSKKKRKVKRYKGNFLTLEEIEEDKTLKAKEEEEFLMLFTHNFDDYDD